MLARNDMRQNHPAAYLFRNIRNPFVLLILIQKFTYRKIGKPEKCNTVLILRISPVKNIRQSGVLYSYDCRIPVCPVFMQVFPYGTIMYAIGKSRIFKIFITPGKSQSD